MQSFYFKVYLIHMISSSSIFDDPVDSLVFGDVATSILNEESSQKSKEDRQASSQ